MSEMPIGEAGQHLAEVAERTKETGEVVYLTDRGRRVAAVVPVADAEALRALEDEIDNAAADAALAEDAPRVPAERLWAELGQ